MIAYRIEDATLALVFSIYSIDRAIGVLAMIFLYCMVWYNLLLVILSITQLRFGWVYNNDDTPLEDKSISRYFRDHPTPQDGHQYAG